jgi:hypothetical protein
VSAPARPPLLIGNLGAEDASTGHAAAAARAAGTAAQLWRLLFAPGARLAARSALGAKAATEAAVSGPAAWPAALGAEPEGPAFPWLDRTDCAFAWLVTEQAEAEALQHGAPLVGPPAAVVRRVHDKGFAWQSALAAGCVPRCLRELIHVLSPAELANPDAARSTIEARLATWPSEADWIRGATLKPRIGSSGRGRVAFSTADDPALVGAIPRLRACGGAILEPWLERTRDLSVQLYLDPSDGLLLLGTLEQRVSPAGVPRGLRGTLDRRGRVTSGTVWDEPLREAAVAIAAAARDAGYFGPCGIDGFVFRGASGEPELRPLVELNARFTLGTVAVGIARRVLQRVRGDFDLDANERLWFELKLGGPAPRAEAGVLQLELAPKLEGPRPVLLLAREIESLEAALAEKADPRRVGRRRKAPAKPDRS